MQEPLKPKPVLFGAKEQMFGLLSLPAQASRTGMIVLNAGLLHNVGPFDLHVGLAGALSSRGFATLRMDQSGKGESPARSGLARVEALIQDYDEAAELMGHCGVEQNVLLGLCSGADDGLDIAAARESVAGLVLFDGWAPLGWGFQWHHYSRRLLSARHWRSFSRRQLDSLIPGGDEAPAEDEWAMRTWDSKRQMLEKLNRVVERGGKLLCVFTGGAVAYYNHVGQLSRTLSRPDSVTEVHFPEAQHIYPVVEHRERMIQHVAEWASATF